MCNCRYTGSDDDGLCGNCLRWWISQSERCTCGFDDDRPCKCGAIKHGAPA
ncbi:hypothetical protein LCGC14_2328870 [marine sediment metagenome]|uniref:Uncharacterized protein n=1 Tax=marine sediment metagenome TaxID=412755 RepID=A0A0F9CG55_9ZZZZ